MHVGPEGPLTVWVAWARTKCREGMADEFMPHAVEGQMDAHESSWESPKLSAKKAPPKVDHVPLDARPFKADLDACELDDRHKPLATWVVRSLLLSRSKLVVLSRRMMFVGKRMLLVAHRIDAEPVLLSSKVADCEYHGDGMYRLVLDLETPPKDTKISQWLDERRAARIAA